MGALMKGQNPSDPEFTPYNLDLMLFGNMAAKPLKTRATYGRCTLSLPILQIFLPGSG